MMFGYCIQLLCQFHLFFCREFGAIPVLINQLNYPEMKVQLAVLGALRNLSYGRLNDDNKVSKLFSLPRLVNYFNEWHII